ncbi:hypothetical protein J6590_065430 [Homalodisca vitripennis]|nr:hypothetical protein J6590_065430 [Homalodisca vitripennis]
MNLRPKIDWVHTFPSVNSKLSTPGDQGAPSQKSSLVTCKIYCATESGSVAVYKWVVSEWLERGGVDATKTLTHSECT